MRIKDHLAHASKIAQYTNVKRAKISALAFLTSGKLIASAHNRRTDGHKTKWTEHAEETLIKKLKKLHAFERFKQIIILVVRINKNGFAMSKPCDKCRKILLAHNVNVFYTTDIFSIEKLKTTKQMLATTRS